MAAAPSFQPTTLATLCSQCRRRWAIRTKDRCPPCSQDPSNSSVSTPFDAIALPSEADANQAGLRYCASGIFIKDLDPREPKYVVLRNAFLARLAASSSVNTPGSLVPATVHRIIAVHNTQLGDRYFPTLFDEIQREESLSQRSTSNYGIFNERRLFGSTLPTVTCALGAATNQRAAAGAPAAGIATTSPPSELSSTPPAPCNAPECELCRIIRSGAPVTDHGLHSTGSGRGVYLAYEPFQAKEESRAVTSDPSPPTAAAPVAESSNVRAAVLYLALLGDQAWTSKPDPGYRFAPNVRSLVIEQGHVPEVLVKNKNAVVPIYVYIFSATGI